MNEETLAGEKGKKLEDIRREAEEKTCPVQRVLYLEVPNSSQCPEH